MRIAAISGPRAGPHIDSFDTGSSQRPGQFIDGRAGGDDIVEQSDVVCRRGFDDAKCVFEITFAFFGGQSCLRRVVAGAPAAG